MIDTIIIPVLNRYDLLNRCLYSLPEQTSVLVIDNGGRYEEAPRSGVDVIRLPANLGVPASWNLGIKLRPFAAGWLLLNSDAWMSEDAWSTLTSDAREDSILLAGSPPWCCAYLPRRVVERVGLFCEAFYPAYMEDVDYEERARRLGVGVVYSSARVEHDNSSTIHSDARLSELNARTHARNIEIYNARWHGVVDGETPSVAEWSVRDRVANAWDA